MDQSVLSMKIHMNILTLLEHEKGEDETQVTKCFFFLQNYMENVRLSHKQEQQQNTHSFSFGALTAWTVFILYA